MWRRISERLLERADRQQDGCDGVRRLVVLVGDVLRVHHPRAPAGRGPGQVDGPVGGVSSEGEGVAPRVLEQQAVDLHDGPSGGHAVGRCVHDVHQSLPWSMASTALCRPLERLRASLVTMRMTSCPLWSSRITSLPSILTVSPNMILISLKRDDGRGSAPWGSHPCPAIVSR